MRNTIRLKTLTASIIACSFFSIANASGVDRSGQGITAFLQDGLYAEAAYSYVDANLSGYDNAYIGPDKKAYIQGKKIDDIAESYDSFSYAVKADLNDSLSIGILYDQPFGAASLYSGDNNFVAQGDRDAVIQGFTGDSMITEFDIDNVLIPQLNNDLSSENPNGLNATELQAARDKLKRLLTAKNLADIDVANAGEGTNVEVLSESVTAILGAKFGENKNIQVYGGPVAQRIEFEVVSRGLGYGDSNGYTIHAKPNQDYGWLAGISYSKPEIALKAALTYRSEIEHISDVSETLPIIAASDVNATQNSAINVTTPESVNFDFQKGLNSTLLATAKVRWVPWSDFLITTPLLGKYPLLEYKKDAWAVDLGLAKRLTPALAVSGNISWDSGTGNPGGSLGPVDGNYGIGVGAKHNLTPNWAISAGGKYLWLGNAKGQLASGKIISDFEDNNAYALGIKLSYQAK